MVAVETMLLNNNNNSINLQGQVEVVIVTNLEIVTKSEDDNGNFNLAYDNQPTFSEAMRATDVVDDDVVSKRLGCLNIITSNTSCKAKKTCHGLMRSMKTMAAGHPH